VFRPDSGDPVEAVLMALKAAEKTFGTTLNGKGYKVIKGAGKYSPSIALPSTKLYFIIAMIIILLNDIACIQGDGINMQSVKTILDAVLKEGFSAQNVAFGMGGGLLQKVNRDTMSFATKLRYSLFPSPFSLIHSPPVSSNMQMVPEEMS
jgi:nicotinic acid phosphoribosyltransferase